jgi:hypothetical protein
MVIVVSKREVMEYRHQRELESKEGGRLERE